MLQWQDNDEYSFHKISLTGRTEGNVLFNGALNTLYLLLHGVGAPLRLRERKPAAATTWAAVSD